MIKDRVKLVEFQLLFITFMVSVVISSVLVLIRVNESIVWGVIALGLTPNLLYVAIQAEGKSRKIKWSNVNDKR